MEPHLAKEPLHWAIFVPEEFTCEPCFLSRGKPEAGCEIADVIRPFHERQIAKRELAADRMLEKSVNLIGAPVPYETFDNSDRASLNARHDRIAHRVLNDIGDIEINRRRCFHAFVQSVIGDRRDWLSAGLFVKPAAVDDTK